MKYLGLVLLVIISFTVGLFSGAMYEVSQQQYKAEEIIGKEVALLEQFKGAPDCRKIHGITTSLNFEKAKGAGIVWSYVQSSDTLKRLVVDSGFNTAFEEIESYCGNKQ